MAIHVLNIATKEEFAMTKDAANATMGGKDLLVPKVAFVLWRHIYDVAICPMGLAWADSVSATDTGHALATCSNRGTCDNKSGDCDCDVGFEGAACERSTFFLNG